MIQSSNNYQAKKKLLTELEVCNTNIKDNKYLEYNVDGCSCMGCGCFKSPWTIVLSPAGVAAGMVAFAAGVAL